MPLMIDAATLQPYLLALDVHGAAMRSALDLMATADDDQFDEYAELSERAGASYQKAQVELVQRLRDLMGAAERRPDCPAVTHNELT